MEIVYRQAGQLMVSSAALLEEARRMLRRLKIKEARYAKTTDRSRTRP